MPVADWNNSIFVLLDQNGIANPIDMNAPGLTVMDSVIGATAVGWTVDLIGGLDLANNPNDFLNAVLGSVNIATLSNVLSPTEVGREVGGLTVQYDNMGITAVNGWLPVGITHDDLVTVTSHDITFTARIQGLRDL